MPTCATCEGTGICPRCGSTKKAFTPTGVYDPCRCRGRGCWGCGGKGTASKPTRPCPACKGNRRCPACDGKGSYRKVGEKKCTTCAHNSGWCATCRGTGEAGRT